MYHVLLTNRYLTTRLIPLIAVAAVALCVALVIIVVSVMTGFLDMVKNSGRTLMGDVVVSYQIKGIPYYGRLIDRLEGLPEVRAATPVVDTFGLIKMPYPAGNNKRIDTVQVWGIDAESFARVTGYADTLYWRPPTEEERQAEADGVNDFRVELQDRAHLDLGMLQRRGLALEDERSGDDVIVLGMHISSRNMRTRDGTYRPAYGPDGWWWMPRFEIHLTLVPIGSEGGLLEPVTRTFKVANEFLSGVFLVDETRVVIPLRQAQEMLRLDEAIILDENADETGFVDPARATMIFIRAEDGFTADQASAQVKAAYNAFLLELLDDDTVDPQVVPPGSGSGVVIQTWRQQQRKFIDPVEKERELMRVLFSIIYFVCAGLVLAIFWAIVYEKTRDIGILRSVGASRLGIGMIFVRYGAVIGVVGAVLGVGLAWLVVYNINTIHDAMGEPAPRWSWISVFAIAFVSMVMLARAVWAGRLLPGVLWALGAVAATGAGVGLMLHRGALIWDPSVYYFTEIPNTLDPVAAVTTAIGAVVFSIIGAFVPAAKAADVDPVQALRYE